MTGPAELYGLTAEFDRPEALLAAVERTRAAGYEAFDAYSPFPIEGLAEAVGFRASGLPWMTLAGAILGAGATLLLEWWINVVDYPLDVGGRPLAAWPAFMLPAFEAGVLFATLFAVVGMLIEDRLPRLYHPIFNAPRFDLATEDRYFLCIESRDVRFEPRRTRTFLESLGALRVEEVAP